MGVFLFNPCCDCGGGCCDLGDCVKFRISPGSGCPCLDGWELELSKVGGGLEWTGTGTPPCGEDMTITLECVDEVDSESCTGYYITIEWGAHGTIGPQAVDVGCSCDPIRLLFTGLVFPDQGAECDGAIEVTITPCDEIFIDCCPEETYPEVVFATFTNVNDCAVYDGLSIPLTWDGVDRWLSANFYTTGVPAEGGCRFLIAVICLPETDQWNLYAVLDNTGVAAPCAGAFGGLGVTEAHANDCEVGAPLLLTSRMTNGFGLGQNCCGCTGGASPKMDVTISE